MWGRVMFLSHLIAIPQDFLLLISSVIANLLIMSALLSLCLWNTVSFSSCLCHPSVLIFPLKSEMLKNLFSCFWAIMDCLEILIILCTKVFMCPQLVPTRSSTIKYIVTTPALEQIHLKFRVQFSNVSPLVWLMHWVTVLYFPYFSLKKPPMMQCETSESQFLLTRSNPGTRTFDKI